MVPSLEMTAEQTQELLDGLQVLVLLAGIAVAVLVAVEAIAVRNESGRVDGGPGEVDGS